MNPPPAKFMCVGGGVPKFLRNSSNKAGLVGSWLAGRGGRPKPKGGKEEGTGETTEVLVAPIDENEVEVKLDVGAVFWT